MPTISRCVTTPLFGKTLAELQQVAAEIGMPRFAAGQMAAWLYRRNVSEIAQMTDLSQKHRDALAENYTVGLVAPSQIHTSADGTRKYLYPTQQGGAIEAALIPDGERTTMCVSSQAGCRMGCEFCMTGRQGLQHNLTAAEILNQARIEDAIILCRWVGGSRWTTCPRCSDHWKY